MPRSHARRMNLVALALLITALIAFVAFHFLPWWEGLSEVSPGWKLWPDVFKSVSRIEMDEDFAASFAFVTSAVMIVVGPFLVGVLQKSRWIWWLVTTMAASALIGLTGVLVVSFLENSDGEILPGEGLLCLVASQVLFLAGLLFIRRETVPDPKVNAG